MYKISIILVSFIIVVFLFIFLLIEYNTMGEYTGSLLTRNIEVVVSRYNEYLEWLSEDPFNHHPIIIYNKGNNNNFSNASNIKSVIKIPNIGRETHSYLYHIVKNYDNLANITVFLPGSSGIPQKRERAIHVIKTIEHTHNTCFYDKIDDLYEKYKNFKIDNWQSSDNTNKQINNENILTPARYRPFGIWFKHKFGNLKITQTSYFGIFAVHKHDILQHPKEFYEELLEEISVSSNPEVGHYYERAWSAIFYKDNGDS